MDTYSRIRDLQTNGSASVAELKEFLGTLKGRRPQEVIGIVSASLLLQSLAVAAVVTVVLLLAGTVVPYVLWGPLKSQNVAAKPAAEAAANRKTSDTARQEPRPPNAVVPAIPDAAKAAQVMGLDEVKGTKPDDKPPEIDNLLDGLDK
jgi:hypothetical protein